VIVAPRPGFYNISESANSPTVFIGKSLRSTYGIIVGEEDEFDRFRRADEINVTKKDIDEEIIDEETIDQELVDKEEIDEEDVWIPYQEFRAPVNRLATTTTVTIYPCRGVGSWLTPDLYQAEHQGISLWAGPTSMIAQESSIQSIQTSCSTALPVNLDNNYAKHLPKFELPGLHQHAFRDPCVHPPHP
jgi:hypothetical protein